MGEILGYPICCVEAYVNGRKPGMSTARVRGVVYLADRSDEDRRRVDAEISEMLGRPWSSSGRFQYVPCEACVGSPGYRTYDEHLEEIVAANLGLVWT